MPASVILTLNVADVFFAGLVVGFVVGLALPVAVYLLRGK